MSSPWTDRLAFRLIAVLAVCFVVGAAIMHGPTQARQAERHLNDLHGMVNKPRKQLEALLDALARQDRLAIRDRRTAFERELDRGARQLEAYPYRYEDEEIQAAAVDLLVFYSNSVQDGDPKAGTSDAWRHELAQVHARYDSALENFAEYHGFERSRR